MNISPSWTINKKGTKTFKLHVCAFDYHHNAGLDGLATNMKRSITHHCVRTCAHTHSPTHTLASVGGIAAGADTLRQTELCSLQFDHIVLLIGWAKLKERSLSDKARFCVCIHFGVFVWRGWSTYLCTVEACQSTFLHFKQQTYRCLITSSILNFKPRLIIELHKSTEYHSSEYVYLQCVFMFVWLCNYE